MARTICDPECKHECLHSSLLRGGALTRFQRLSGSNVLPEDPRMFFVPHPPLPILPLLLRALTPFHVGGSAGPSSLLHRRRRPRQPRGLHLPGGLRIAWAGISFHAVLCFEACEQSVLLTCAVRVLMIEGRQGSRAGHCSTWFAIRAPHPPTTGKAFCADPLSLGSLWGPRCRVSDL